MLSDLHIQAHEIIVQSGQTSPNVISPRFELIIKQFAKRFTKEKNTLARIPERNSNQNNSEHQLVHKGSCI
jgi:hypothetical protein